MDKKRPVKPLGWFIVPETWAVLQVCALSDVPKSMKERGRSAACWLVLLVAERERHWLNIVVVSVELGCLGYSIEHVQPLVPPSAQQDVVQVSFFTTSHTDKILVLGGCGLLQFYSVFDSKGELAMSLIEDCAETFPEIRHGHMVSCLGIPPLSRTFFDWIVVGDSNGKLYGFRFDMNDRNGGRIEMNTHTTGRFRTNTHDEAVPVHGLIATYGTQEAHYKAIPESGLDYASFLKVLQKDDRAFYSLGENGRLLHWSFERTGWQSAESIKVPELPMPDSLMRPSPNSCRFVAGHASRLIPHVVVLADANGRSLLCLNCLSGTVEKISSYA